MINLLIIVVLALGLPVLVGALGGGERLRNLVEQSGPLAPMVYVAAKAAVTIVAPLSGIPLKAASGTLFGFAGGFAYSVLGDVIGGCICFLASRHLGRGLAERLVLDDRMAPVHRVVDRGVGGWRELLFCRVTFSAIYNLLSCAAGTTRLPFWQYVLVTTFGGIAHTGILVTIGTSAALSWSMRLATYAAIAAFALLALLAGRYIRRAFDPASANRAGVRPATIERENGSGNEPLQESNTYAARGIIGSYR